VSPFLELAAVIPVGALLLVLARRLATSGRIASAWLAFAIGASIVTLAGTIAGTILLYLLLAPRCCVGL
jgi:hypothetical protein